MLLEGVWSTSGIEAMARFPSSESLVILYAVAAPEKSAFTAVSGMQEDTFEVNIFPVHIFKFFGITSFFSGSVSWQPRPLEAGLRPPVRVSVAKVEGEGDL